ncbi:hypothetical protein KIH07_06520 [Hydrogenophaga taeniospiralis]|uniref:hypothetical protein n=1 Tax=Hydrogenophaga taeniospiralis TaxID=65656 RepID=UPI001CFC19AD|nr:hypothetical protein [Hydrogenophaga taeniospiralis]MCB4363380.1 hypothetical protein [Hydrogenophaga taeniospiralis]
MKRTVTMVCALVAMTTTPHVFALPFGTCLLEADMRKALKAEGQSITTEAANKRSYLSLGAAASGYLIEVRGSSWCIAAALENVSTLRTKSVDICSDPSKYPNAVAVCNDLKAKVKGAGSLSAQSSTATLLAPETKGPVIVNLGFCDERDGRRTLCARSETVLK